MVVRSLGDGDPRKEPTMPARMLVLLLALVASATLGADASAARTLYYVDCAAGDDAGPGTPAAAAWQTLARANAAALNPGDGLRLRRGCVFHEALLASWVGTPERHITIGAYGRGALPRIENAYDDVYVTGSYLDISRLWTHSDPPARDPDCDNQSTGRLVGFRFFAPAAYDTLTRSVATGHFIGVLVD